MLRGFGRIFGFVRGSMRGHLEIIAESNYATLICWIRLFVLLGTYFTDLFSIIVGVLWLIPTSVCNIWPIGCIEDNIAPLQHLVISWKVKHGTLNLWGYFELSLVLFHEIKTQAFRICGVILRHPSWSLFAPILRFTFCIDGWKNFQFDQDHEHVTLTCWCKSTNTFPAYCPCETFLWG